MPLRNTTPQVPKETLIGSDDTVVLTSEALSISAASEAVLADDAGAVTVFMGTTRDNFEGKRVVQLEYEAYEPMARAKMHEVIVALRAKWQVRRVYMGHRTGVVPVQEPSVIIAVSSAHRRESIRAAEFAIDTLKASVPIWKKEIYDDGSKWKANSDTFQPNPSPSSATIANKAASEVASPILATPSTAVVDDTSSH